jgi:hypothetical protein
MAHIYIVDQTVDYEGSTTFSVCASEEIAMREIKLLIKDRYGIDDPEFVRLESGVLQHSRGVSSWNVERRKLIDK